MTPSAHENSAMEKSTATSSITFNNPDQPLDHSKVPGTSNATVGKVLAKLQPNTVNTEKTMENNDATMHLFDEDLDDDIIKSVATSPNANSYNNDMKDRTIKHESEMNL